jgi:hypothetical protein
MASNGQCQTRNRPKDAYVIYQICRHSETVCPTVQVPLTPVDPAAMAGHTLATHIAGYGSMVYPPIHATAIFTKAINIAAARRPKRYRISHWQRCRPSLHLNFWSSFWLLFFLALIIMVGFMHSSGSKTLADIVKLAMTHAVHVGPQDSQPQTLRTPFSTPSKTPYARPLSETTEIYETDVEDDESLFEENSPKPSFGSVSSVLLCCNNFILT